MRLQELHPAMVHFPIALLPLSVGADALGRITGSRVLSEVGRGTMPLAAAGAILAGLTGLIAQESARVREDAHPLLVTHRNLNVALITLTSFLARRRAAHRRPGLGYLAAGVGGVGFMVYTAYLGGRMVYEHGVGVKPAGGLEEDAAPEIRAQSAGRAARLAREHLLHGIRHAWEHLRQGEVAPLIAGNEAGSEPGRGGEMTNAVPSAAERAR